LGEEIPLERRHQRGVPSRNLYFTTISSSSVKFSALNVHSNSASFDPLGSRSPPYECIKFGYPVQNTRIMLLSTNLARDWLQIDAYSSLRITSFEVLTDTRSSGLFTVVLEPFSLKMHHGGKKAGQNRGKGHRIFSRNKLDLTFQAPNHCAKFRKNRIKNAALFTYPGGMGRVRLS